jgi:hypothetical protein
MPLSKICYVPIFEYPGFNINETASKNVLFKVKSAKGQPKVSSTNELHVAHLWPSGSKSSKCHWFWLSSFTGVVRNHRQNHRRTHRHKHWQTDRTYNYVLPKCEFHWPSSIGTSRKARLKISQSNYLEWLLDDVIIYSSTSPALAELHRASRDRKMAAVMAGKWKSCIIAS